MRKTLCICCMKIWKESRDISISDSQCPNCGEGLRIENKKNETKSK